MERYNIRNTLMFATLDDTRKIGPKTFVVVKTAVFWIVCFYRLLRSQTKYLIICIILVKIPAGPLYFVALPFHVRLNDKEKAGNFSSSERLPFFEYFVFLTTIWVKKASSDKIQTESQKNLWTLINCSLMFLTLDITRKSRSKTFVTVKKFFFETSVSIDLLGAKEMLLSFEQS